MITVNMDKKNYSTMVIISKNDDNSGDSYTNYTIIIIIII